MTRIHPCTPPRTNIDQGDQVKPLFVSSTADKRQWRQEDLSETLVNDQSVKSWSGEFYNIEKNVGNKKERW